MSLHCLSLTSLPPPPPDNEANPDVHPDFESTGADSCLLVSTVSSQVGFYASKSLLQAASPLFKDIQEPQFIDETPENLALLLHFMDVARSSIEAHDLDIEDVWELHSLVVRYALIRPYHTLLRSIVIEGVTDWTSDWENQCCQLNYRALIFKLMIIAHELQAADVWNVLFGHMVGNPRMFSVVCGSLLPLYLDVGITILAVLRTAERLGGDVRAGYTDTGRMFLYNIVAGEGESGADRTRHYI